MGWQVDPHWKRSSSCHVREGHNDRRALTENLTGNIPKIGYSIDTVVNQKDLHKNSPYNGKGGHVPLQRYSSCFVEENSSVNEGLQPINV